MIYASYEVKEIASIEELRKLFYAFAPSGKDSPEVVEKIIGEVYRHTLTVEMAAKTLCATGLTADEVLKSLKEDTLNLSNPNKISIQTDARLKTATPKEHLTRLFQLQDLSEEYQGILQHIRLIPDSGIPKRLFCKWVETADYNMVNDLIRYGWIQQDEETNRISIHPFLNEVLEITGCPSFLKCQQFMEHVGNEYIADVEDEIFYRDLISLTKSIFKKIVVDDTLLAFCLLEKILKYLEKYVYYNTMKDMLKLFEKIIMTGTETKYQTAIYQFYMGVKTCWELKPETGAEYFQNALSLLKPFGKSNAELAISIYHKLSEIYALSADQKQLLSCAQSMVELRTLYGSTDSPDYEYENLMLALASKDINNMELEEILEIPELEAFAQRARKENIFNVSKEDFLKDIEKVEPDELNQMKSIYQYIKDDLQDIVLSQQGDISLTDVMTRVFENAEKYIKTDDLCN